MKPRLAPSPASHSRYRDTDLRTLAADLATEWSLEERLAHYQPHRWLADWNAAPPPAIHLDDFSAIPFLDGVSGVADYQHRARLRARSGDAFVATTPPADGAEDYFRERLGLGSPIGIVAEPTAGPLAIAQACLEPDILDLLAALSPDDRRLAVHPFMGIEAVWELATVLAQRSGRQVRVLAPPPPVTWIANDKKLFDQLVLRTLGPKWVVEGKPGRDTGELVRHLLELAGRHGRVALKRLRCASAMGNRVFDSAELLALSRAGLVETVELFLQDTQWDGKEDVLAVAWEETDVSPSTQWWIPPVGSGEPRLDGIYEQILSGEAKVFVGSRPSRLPVAVNRALGRAAFAVARVLQELGYVGRCSFDHLVIGDPEGEPELRFTECNGRWGGTSTPMFLVDRAVGLSSQWRKGRGAVGPDSDGQSSQGEPAIERPCYRAQDVVLPELIGMPFPEVLRRVGDALFDTATGEGRYLFYNLGPLREHGKLDAIALAETSEDADWALEVHLPELLTSGC